MATLLRLLVPLALLGATATSALAQGQTPPPARTAIEKRWAHPPTGFSVAVLEPLGGRTLVPFGWSMMATQEDTTWMWTLVPSGARAKKGEPDAMVSIQVQPRVSETEKMLPSAWIGQAFAAKKTAAVRVLCECGPTQAGFFVRYCLEVVERSPQGRVYRTNISAFAADGSDLLALTMQRSLLEQWDTYAPSFATMANIELIDMERFEEPAKR